MKRRFLFASRHEPAQADPQRPLHHVRPTASRLPVLLRPSLSAHAEHRPPGRGGRALRPCLYPGHHLRAVADVLVHRALRQQPPGGLERGAAAAGGADPGRLPARRGSPHRAGRQDPRHGQPGRHAAARHRSGQRARAALAEAGFEPYDRNDGVYPDDPAFADKRESAPYTHYLRRLGFTGDNPWHDWANSAASADGKSSAAGGCAMPDCRHACRRRTARPPIPPVAPWISSTSRASVPGACTCPTSSRTGPTSRRRRTALYRADQVLPALRAAPGEAITRCTAPSANIARPQFLPRRRAPAGDTYLHGADPPGRRPARPALPAHARQRALGRYPDRLHQ